MNPRLVEGDALAALRRATTGAHERLDGLAQRAGVTSSRAQYAAHFAALLSFQRAFCRQAEPWADVATISRHRLATLERDQEILEAPPAADCKMRLTSLSQVWGACYVSEGSRLGSRTIAKRLRMAGTFVDDLASLTEEPDQVSRCWQTVITHVNALATSEIEEAILGAQRAFLALIAVYERSVFPSR